MASQAEALATRLDRAAADLIAVLEQIDERSWRQLPNSGVWSVSKDADHVGDAAIYHQWIVRRSIGEKVPSRRPAIERSRMTSDRSPAEVAALIRERTDEGVRLILRLTDEQLALPTRPPRAGDPPLAETIERVLIGHYDAHRLDIDAKLQAVAH